MLRNFVAVPFVIPSEAEGSAVFSGATKDE
jgi:hypothetical protein